VNIPAVTTIYLIIIITLLVIQLVSMVIRRKRFVKTSDLERIEKHYMELLDVYHHVAAGNIMELEKKVAELKPLLAQADQRIRTLTVILGNQTESGTYCPQSHISSPASKSLYGSVAKLPLSEPAVLPVRVPGNVVPALNMEDSGITVEAPSVTVEAPSISVADQLENNPVGEVVSRRSPEDVVPQRSVNTPVKQAKKHYKAGAESVKKAPRVTVENPVAEKYKNIIGLLDDGIEVEQIIKETKASRGVVTLLTNIRNLRRREITMRAKGVREED